MNKNKNLVMKTSALNYLIGFIILLISLCGLTACSSEEKSLSKYIHEIKSRPARPIEPIPEFVTPKKFEYPENEQRRSPFRPIKTVEKKDSLAPNEKRPKQPLEAFQLDALKFVGIIEVGTVRWGLISQPGGLITRVKPGDYMGKNFGQIQQITKNTIKLEETVKVGGRWEKRAVTLELRKP